jgi:hypothetical protein
MGSVSGMKKLSSHIEALLIGSTATNIWFPEFRRADIDLYAMPEFREKFLRRCASQIKKVIANTPRKIYAWTKDDQAIDMVFYQNDGSYIPDLIEANQCSKVVNLCGIDVHVAKPTTLLLIKDVHSCFRRLWMKHICDFAFLASKVKRSYCEKEQDAYRKSLPYFKRMYRDDAHKLVNFTIDEISQDGIDLDRLHERVLTSTLETRVLIKRYLLEKLGVTI